MPADNYPTDEELERIRNWPATDDWTEFFAFVRSVGNYWPSDDPFGWHEVGGVYAISTGGWSGNEDIIEAMHDNWIFWSMNFVSHRRGGHYEFVRRQAKNDARERGTEGV